MNVIQTPCDILDFDKSELNCDGNRFVKLYVFFFYIQIFSKCS